MVEIPQLPDFGPSSNARKKASQLNVALTGALESGDFDFAGELIEHVPIISGELTSEFLTLFKGKPNMYTDVLESLTNEEWDEYCDYIEFTMKSEGEI